MAARAGGSKGRSALGGATGRTANGIARPSGTTTNKSAKAAKSKRPGSQVFETRPDASNSDYAPNNQPPPVM